MQKLRKDKTKNSNYTDKNEEICSTCVVKNDEKMVVVVEVVDAIQLDPINIGFHHVIVDQRVMLVVHEMQQKPTEIVLDTVQYQLLDELDDEMNELGVAHDKFLFLAFLICWTIVAL